MSSSDLADMEPGLTMSSKLHSAMRNPHTGPLSYIDTEDSRAPHQSVPKSKEDCEGLTDEDLLGLITLRSREALEVLYDRFSGAIFSMAVHMLRDSGAAEEVTQDTFFKVWGRASSYKKERGKATSWMFSIAHHRVVDEVRRRRRREQLQVQHDVDLLRQPADDSGDPGRYAVRQSERSEMKKALSVLRKEQREVVVLAYYGGLTHTEIASRLEQPLGTVKTRMRLALKKLRGVLGPSVRELA